MRRLCRFSRLIHSFATIRPPCLLSFTASSPTVLASITKIEISKQLIVYRYASEVGSWVEGKPNTLQVSRMVSRIRIRYAVIDLVLR